LLAAVLKERGDFLLKIGKGFGNGILDEDDDFGLVSIGRDLKEFIPDGITSRERITGEADAVSKLERDLVISIRHRKTVTRLIAALLIVGVYTELSYCFFERIYIQS